MISIKKPTHRVTRQEYSVLYTKPRRIVVTIQPGDVLSFREHGRRARFLLAIDTAFRYAVRLHAATEVLHKSKRRKR